MRRKRLTPIVSMQNRYNLGDRDSDALVDLCEQESMTFLPWAPIQDLNKSRALTKVAAHHDATPQSGDPGVVAPAVAGDVADPGHRIGRAPRGATWSVPPSNSARTSTNC